MSLLLDAGAFLAAERRDRLVATLIKSEVEAGDAPITHGGVIGQVWRGARQASLARLLPACRIVTLDEGLGRRAGALLARARAADVIDAALIVLASDGDRVLTSDPSELEALAAAAGVHVELVEI